MTDRASMRARAYSPQVCLASGWLLATLLLLPACGGGGGNDPEPPAASAVQAVGFDSGSVRIAADAGSADAGTAVAVVSGATGSGVAAADGSFSFDAVLDAAAASLSVQYTKDDYTLTSTSTVVDQASLVDAPLFSTGSGPNDMVYGNGSLYVANSMDNTVVRYSLTGEALATASFDTGASPSYLALADDALWVSCNGNNCIQCLDPDDLAQLEGGEFQLTGEAAFIGPSQPVIAWDTAYVPRNEMVSFSPTTYGTGKVAGLDLTSGSIFELTTTGLNPQFGVYDSTRDSLYITCSGDIQFDEYWTPYADSDSYLERLAQAGDSSDPVQLNLGKIGAGRIALSPDGAAACLGTSLAANLYLVDLASFTATRGESNPITLTSDYSYASDVAYSADGRYILALSYNTDELYVVDASTGELNPGPYPAPFDLALDASMMAGAMNLELVPDSDGSYAVYVLYGVGNAVAKVELF